MEKVKVPAKATVKFKVGRMMKIKLHDDHEVVLDGQVKSGLQALPAQMAGRATLQPPTAQA
jgi:hypothetical protein